MAEAKPKEEAARRVALESRLLELEETFASGNKHPLRKTRWLYEKSQFSKIQV
jgi:hypothetical protein